MKGGNTNNMVNSTKLPISIAPTSSTIETNIISPSNSTISTNNQHVAVDENAPVAQLPPLDGLFDKVEHHLPIANVIRLMRRVLPPQAKISDEAKETVQECVSEFITLITQEANDRSRKEQRKTIRSEDLICAMSNLGFDDYVEPLTLYLDKYREANVWESSRGRPRPTHVAAPTMMVRPPMVGPNSTFAPRPGMMVRPTGHNQHAGLGFGFTQGLATATTATADAIAECNSTNIGGSGNSKRFSSNNNDMYNFDPFDLEIASNACKGDANDVELFDYFAKHK